MCRSRSRSVHACRNQSFLLSARVCGRAAVQAIDLLTRKIASIELFNATYPGFGGYLPWFDVENGTLILKSPDWLDRTPGLDNGEMLWAMFGAAQVLNSNNFTALGQRYRAYVDYMASTVLPGNHFLQPANS
jgi:hypothetical protein